MFIMFRLRKSGPPFPDPQHTAKTTNLNEILEESCLISSVIDTGSLQKERECYTKSKQGCKDGSLKEEKVVQKILGLSPSF